MEFPYLHNLVNFLHLHPHVGGIITFLIAFTESLPLIGAVIPGSVTMTAVGALIGSGAMPMGPTLLWAIFGAFCGDYLSYWLGAHYNERIRTIWPFSKKQHWLLKGENFFRLHGGKSVIIGRFFGPVRSAVPLIAGLMHMTKVRFILAAFPSAFMWSLVYIVPGIVVGALSLELPPATATKFILTILAIVAFGWIVLVGIHFFFKKLAIAIDSNMAHVWQYLENHRSLHWLTTLLSPDAGVHRKPTRFSLFKKSAELLQVPFCWIPHRQLTLLIATLVMTALFWLVFFNVANEGWLTHWNVPFFLLLRSLRAPLGDNIMIACTLLGEKYVLIPAAALIFLWLILRRYFWVALHWVLAILLTMAVILTFKEIYYSARPIGLLNWDTSSSFPSGHTLLATMFYGFASLLIAQGLPPGRRKLPLGMAGFIILLIGLSRLYLGMHWLTDVLGSICIGLAIILFVFLLYRRRPARPVVPHSFTVITLIVTLVVWAGFGLTHFQVQQEEYAMYWPRITLDTTTWWNNRDNDVPLFLASRLGKPHDVLNVQWLGEATHLQQILVKQGWKVHTAASLNLKNTFQRLSPRTNPQHLPLLPTLYQNQAPDLWFTKLDAQNRQINLIFWKANIRVIDSNQPLWLGSLHYAAVHPRGHSLPQQVPSASPFQLLSLNFPGLETKIIKATNNQQQSLMQQLHWDGLLLLVNDKSTPTR